MLVWLGGTFLAIVAACSGVDGGDNPPLRAAKPNEPTGGIGMPGFEGTEPPSGGAPEGDDSFQGDAGVPQGDGGLVAETGVGPDATSGAGGNTGDSIIIVITGAGGGITAP